MDTHPRRVVIIGSGFGGLFGAQALADDPVEVTLISRTSNHLFQPLLYQVATGILSEGEIAPATREVLARQRNARVALGEVVHIDLERREVHHELLGRRTVTPYDDLIVAAGSTQSFFGHPEFAEHAPGMKTIDDALELRGRIFGAFEAAELSDDPEDRARLMTFVVVGAGPTGVEMAGQIAELSHRTLVRDFRRIDTADARIILLDAADQVLPPFGKRLGRRTQRDLERLGIEVQLGAKVTGVDATGITVEDEQGERRIESVVKVWAAGVAASPLAQHLADQCGAPVDKAGRVEVRPDLTLPGHPEVYVVGDMAGGLDLPGVAQTAIQGARFAAQQIRHEVRGEPRDPKFDYRDKGSMATISRAKAVAKIGRLELTGTLAWLAWLAVHLVYIIGFKHRVTTLLHWAVSFIGRGRAERAVTEQQTFARNALASMDEDYRPTLPRPQDNDAARRTA